MKCEICKTQIKTTILDKIEGTVVKDKNGKKHNICNSCQSKYPSKDKILDALVA